MASHRDAIFVNRVYVEKSPLPADIPHVSEVGATSAALETAAFFIGAHCKDVNEDFMLCKKESADPSHCLKEGRRVTRCAQDLWVRGQPFSRARLAAIWIPSNDHLADYE